MRKICEISGKIFNARSNRQKYCKSVLCGTCPLRTEKEKPNVFVEILKQSQREYDGRYDSNNEVCKISIRFQNDNFWGLGNLKDDESLKPHLLPSKIRKQKTRVYNALFNHGDYVLCKVEHRTNANQYSKSKLKYRKFFVQIDTSRFTCTSVEIPYCLAIGLMHEIQ